MSMSEKTTDMYTRVGIFKDEFPMARYFFDIHVTNEGFAGYYMWRRNENRFPIYHHLKDFLKRRARGSSTLEQSLRGDERHFFVKFEDIQGVVTDREHKEIQLLSVKEEMKLLFRPYHEYDEFAKILESKLGERYFTRDNIDIEDSVYI